MHFYDKLLAYRNSMGLARDMGIRILEIREGYAKSEMLIHASQQNLIGSVHGGILMTFADIVGAAAAWSYGTYTTTMSCSVNFLNAAMNVDRLWAEAQVEKRGKQTIVARVVITDSTGRKILVSTFSFFSLGKPIELDDPGGTTA